MILHIDNGDGLGPLDYSAALSPGLSVVRTLQQPSTLSAELCLQCSALRTPVRQARVQLTSDTGTLLFTGYLVTQPVPLYAGEATEGPVFRYALRAASDEPLLTRTSSAALTAPLPTTHDVTGSLLPGALTADPIDPGSLRELANDVLLTGEQEPAAYWTELFTGDGTTAQFVLTGQGTAATRGHATLLQDDFLGAAFNPQLWSLQDPGSFLGLSGSGLALTGGNGLDGQTTLSLADPVELGGTLVLELGSVALDPTSAGVLGGLYSGGALTQANLFAGFHIRPSSSGAIATPMVNGTEVGTSLTLTPGHRYNLRLRLHCPEMLRSRQTYTARVHGSTQSFGGGLVPAPMALVFEARDLGLSSNTPATLLYDGAIPSSPAFCTLAAANSLQLSGSVGLVALRRTGSAWVTSRDPATGTTATRLVDGTGQGADCTFTNSSTAGPSITFYPGRVPAAGEMVWVSYRGSSRAVARMADTARVAAQTALGGNGTSRWLGQVDSPPARTSEDCENAALAVLALVADPALATSGTCTVLNPRLPTGAPEDLQPGDLLTLPAPQTGLQPGSGTASAAGSLQTILRRVELTSGHAAPELLRYRLTFSNHWPQALGFTLSESTAAPSGPYTLLPATLLPATATDSTLPASARVLPNLAAFTVLGSSGPGADLALSVDAGTTPPAGGGFEVRRRDGGWGTGLGTTQPGSGTAQPGSGTAQPGPDLVLRSPVRGFALPLTSAGERFFIRMYDGSTPPLYSRLSTAILSNLPTN